MKCVSLFVLWLAFLIAGCKKGPSAFQPLDLSPYRIPMVIQAPDSAQVLEKDYKFMRDLIIRKGRDFDLQIFELNASSQDAAGEKLHQLTSVREDPFFKEVVREDEHGFIYAKRLDSTRVDYDFRYIKLLGDKELIFQTGLTGTFNLDAVTTMYNAIRQE